MRLLTFVLASVFALNVSACAKKKPPEPPPAPPPVPTKEPEPEAPPPPPPPKCEALSEKCKTTDEKQLSIPKAKLTYKLASGWIYATLPDSSVAELDDATGGVLGFTTYDSPKKAADMEKNREAALDALSKALGVTLPKKKLTFFTPGDTKPVGALKVQIFEFKDAERGAKKGELGVFIAALPGDRSVIGLAWKGDGDPADAQKAAFEAIGSLAPEGG